MRIVRLLVATRSQTFNGCSSPFINFFFHFLIHTRSLSSFGPGSLSGSQISTCLASKSAVGSLMTGKLRWWNLVLEYGICNRELELARCSLDTHSSGALEIFRRVNAHSFISSRLDNRPRFFSNPGSISSSLEKQCVLMRHDISNFSVIRHRSLDGTPTSTLYCLTTGGPSLGWDL